MDRDGIKIKNQLAIRCLYRLDFILNRGGGTAPSPPGLAPPPIGPAPPIGPGPGVVVEQHFDTRTDPINNFFKTITFAPRSIVNGDIMDILPLLVPLMELESRNEVSMSGPGVLTIGSLSPLDEF